MKFILLFFFSFLSLNVQAQVIEQEFEKISSPTKEKTYLGTFSFTKRVLEETSFMSQNRIDKTKAGSYVSPDSIEFELQTFGIRYQASPKLAIEVGGSHMKSQVHIAGELTIPLPPGPPGAPPFVKIPIDKTVGSSGMGDTRLGIIYKAHQNGKHLVTTSTHFNIPTGSVNERDEDYIFPYAGQLGSGTYDLIPQIKYDYGKTGFISGSKLQYTLRTGRNKSDYRMGNQALFDSYVGYDYKRMAALLIKGRIRNWNASSDPRYQGPKARVDDPYVEKGTRWEVLATARTGLPLPKNIGAFIIEGGVPIYQDQNSGEVQFQTGWFISSRIVAGF
jgi:hypothetical protein